MECSIHSVCWKHMNFLQKLFRLVSTHCACANESSLSAGLTGYRDLEQEGADACLPQRGAELTHIPASSYAANPQKTKPENSRAGETKAVWAGGRKCKQDTDQKGRVHISGHYSFTGTLALSLFWFWSHAGIPHLRLYKHTTKKQSLL